MDTIDIVGQILWYLIPATPLITVPFVWFFSKQKKAIKIVTGLLLAVVVSFFLFFISLGIVCRNGLGP